jgi:hypothetical protein
VCMRAFLSTRCELAQPTREIFLRFPADLSAKSVLSVSSPWLAGRLAALRCCVHTLQVKLRMQMQGHSAVPSGVMETALGMLRREGLRSFFRGSTPALASALIENTVVFAAHGALGRLLQPEQSSGAEGIALQCTQHALSGFCSATAICAPEVVKVRLQNSSKRMSARSAWDACLGVWHTDGVSGFFRGLVPLWARDVPFYVVFFGSYEGFSSLCFNHVTPAGSTDLSGPLAFMCGGLAGSTSWAAVFPFDVIKSRQQAALGVPDNMLQTGRRVVAESGATGLFRGVAPCVVRGFPANGALFLGVTMTQRLFRWYDNRG